MQIRVKAARLLRKLYMIRKVDFALLTVDDLLEKATAAEIEYYYSMICERRR